MPRHPLLTLVLLLTISVSACQESSTSRTASSISSADETMALPEPRTEGPLSLEAALQRRRSVREFSAEPLTIEELSQLLWSAQGITDSRGYRTAPSAGALYPLELYLATSEGLFRYIPEDHALLLVRGGDLRPQLSDVALGQESIAEAPATIIFTAVFSRTEERYGTARSPRYIHLEAGHAAQNVLLQAVALGLGAVPVGAFHDSRLSSVLDLPSDHVPLYLVPIGRQR